MNCNQKWRWSALKFYCPAPVEQEKFPTENSGYVLHAATPCTDGETLFVPEGYGQEAFLFHELGHFLMHYPNGKDAGLIDPDVRNQSKWEAEACLFGRLVCKGLDLDPGYNDDFLYAWRGDPSRIDYPTVFQKAAEIITHYRTHAKEEDFEEVIPRRNQFLQGWDWVPDSGYPEDFGYKPFTGNNEGAEGGEEGVQEALPFAKGRNRNG